MLYLILILYFFSISYIYMCAYFIWEKHDPIPMRYSKNMYRRYVIHFVSLILLITYILCNGIIFSVVHVFLYIVSAILGYTLSFCIHCVHCYTYYNRRDIFIYIQIISTITFICFISILFILIIL